MTVFILALDVLNNESDIAQLKALSGSWRNKADTVSSLVSSMIEGREDVIFGVKLRTNRTDQAEGTKRLAEFKWVQRM